MRLNSGNRVNEGVDAWLASLSANYESSSSGMGDVASMIAELARRSFSNSRSGAYGESSSGGHGSNHTSGRGISGQGLGFGQGYGGTLGYTSGRSRSRSSSKNSQETQEEALTKLIAAIAKLQAAIEDNTGSYGGTGGKGRNSASVTGDILSGAAHGAQLGVFGNTAGAIGAGIGGLLGAFGVKGANRYFDAVAGAGNIYNTGAKQGVTVQNVISGAAQGATLGSAFGPVGTAIGAGVGGLLDIFGGLFGRHKPAVPQTKVEDPAYYNSPSDFEYDAARYNALGKYPNLAGQAFNTVAPIVQFHFYSDGVETAVNKAVASSTSRSAMTVGAAYYDATRPQ